MRVLKMLCCATAMVVFLAPGARADEWNKRTFLTFSGPVQIPGATLPAGTYLFQLAAPDSSRHVVMVRSKDENKIYGMFITIPNDRLEAPDENVVMFAESPAGTPRAIQTWWYPGDRTGEEFVYPKNQAMMIAKANRTPVLATEASASSTASESDRMNELRGSKVGRVDETGTMKGGVAATNTAESVNAQNNAQATVGATAEPTTAAPPNTVNGRDVRASKSSASKAAVGTSGKAGRKHLPRTASNLTLVELLSALSIAGGLSARALRKRLAVAR